MGGGTGCGVVEDALDGVPLSPSNFCWTPLGDDDADSENILLLRGEGDSDEDFAPLSNDILCLFLT